jgi:hypothetical protein
MEFTDENKQIIKNKMISIGSKNPKEIIFWHDHGFNDETSITIKYDGKVILREAKGYFTFDEYMDVLDRADIILESLVKTGIMPKCP